MNLYVQRDSEFRQLFKIPRIEWCEIMSGTKNSNPWAKSILKSAKDSCPGAIQKCPYLGKLEMLNIRGYKEVFGILPKGVFRFSVKAVDGNKNVLNFSCSIEVSE
jgi:Protein of unknown function (DUF1091)